jgi:isopenicillin N synthase-like dioxygenase
MMAFWSGGKLKATRHRVTFEGVPARRERLSMAYFGTAVPETVLKPVVAGGAQVGGSMYGDNGVQFIEGMTVGEYGDLIMRNIYGNGPVAVK